MKYFWLVWLCLSDPPVGGQASQVRSTASSLVKMPFVKNYSLERTSCFGFFTTSVINKMITISQPMGYGKINIPHHQDKVDVPPKPPSDEK